jgi:hypothetical protein
MSNEKIKLPDFLIADLFKGTLVEIDNSAFSIASSNIETSSVRVENIELPSTKRKFLGDNKKGIIIIVDQPNETFLADNDLTFLTNILKACQLHLSDIAIVNNAVEKMDYQTLKEELSAEVIILFDVEPSAIKLPFMIPAFQIQKYDNCTLMVAPPLHLLNNPTNDGKLLKTKLWMSLKKVFNIQ